MKASCNLQQNACCIQCTGTLQGCTRRGEMFIKDVHGERLTDHLMKWVVDMEQCTMSFSDTLACNLLVIWLHVQIYRAMAACCLCTRVPSTPTHHIASHHVEHAGSYDVSCKLEGGTPVWAVVGPILGAAVLLLVLAGTAFKYRKEIAREWWTMKVNRIKRRCVPSSCMPICPSAASQFCWSLACLPLVNRQFKMLSVDGLNSKLCMSSKCLQGLQVERCNRTSEHAVR